MLSVIADIASILGFVASLAAFFAAMGAKDAAKQARRTVRLGDASERLNALGSRATELLGLIENGDIAAASLRSRDLTSELVRAKLRWERFLSTESKTVLTEAVAQIQAISKQIATKGIPAQNKPRLLTFCHSVNESLNGESARMLAEIESKEE